MWNIEDYDEKYLDAMLEMTKENYSEDNDISNIEFICHEYFLNPAGKAFIQLANDKKNNILAGQYIVIPRIFLVEGEEVQAVLSLNTLTKKSYRGQGIFVALAEQVYRNCEESGIAFCYGAPNQNSFHGFIKKNAIQ